LIVPIHRNTEVLSNEVRPVLILSRVPMQKGIQLQSSFVISIDKTFNNLLTGISSRYRQTPMQGDSTVENSFRHA